MKRVFLITALVSSPALATPAQFDLVCAGEQQIYISPAMIKKPFKAIYHIDLIKSEFCIDDCKEIRKIQEVDSLRITLVDQARGHGTVTPIRDQRILDRRTGALKIDYLNGATLERLIVAAACESKPFTPFPQTKF